MDDKILAAAATAAATTNPVTATATSESFLQRVEDFFSHIGTHVDDDLKAAAAYAKPILSKIGAFITTYGLPVLEKLAETEAVAGAEAFASTSGSVEDKSKAAGGAMKAGIKTASVTATVEIDNDLLNILATNGVAGLLATTPATDPGTPA